MNRKVDLALPGKKLARSGIKVQTATGAIVIGITAIMLPQYWISALIGVIAFLVPHSIFAYWVFRYAGATKNEIVAQSLNQGMKIKLILTVIMFVIAFSQLNTHPVVLLSAYAITMVSQWLAMFWLSPRS